MPTEDGASVVGKPPFGVYVHLPFCLSRCGYCDFAVVTDRDDQQAEYVSALKHEAAFWHRHAIPALDTLYFGGGTPSRLKPELWTSLLDAIRSEWTLRDHAEISVEANPESITPGLLSLWRELGINRISMGAQSFQDGILRAIDRSHNSARALEAIREIRQAGFENWSLDLIYGLPGQSLSDWVSDLEIAIAEAPAHLSFYNLILHPNLPATLKAQSMPSDEMEELHARMFLKAIDFFSANGYEVYELSNAARPGFRCEHNLLYWRLHDWIGLGMSAHSHLNRCYFANPSSWMAYIEAWSGEPEELPVAEQRPGRESCLLDCLMLGLRLADGVSLRQIESLYGKALPKGFHALLAEMARQGYVNLDEKRFAPTAEGWLLHSEITARLMNLLPFSVPE